MKLQREEWVFLSAGILNKFVALCFDYQCWLFLHPNCADNRYREMLKLCNTVGWNWKTRQDRKYCRQGGVRLFHGISQGCAQKGKIHELVRHFSTGFKTLEFSLQTFKYRSESYYIMRRRHPAWMYVVSMLVERIRSFVQLGKRRKMFSRDLKLWQEGNKIPYCTTTCQCCPNWNPVSSGLSGYSAACLTSIDNYETV